jgi:hypothetical protein
MDPHVQFSTSWDIGFWFHKIFFPIIKKSGSPLTADNLYMQYYSLSLYGAFLDSIRPFFDVLYLKGEN